MPGRGERGAGRHRHDPTAIAAAGRVRYGAPFAAEPAVAAVPLLAAPASASCTDDLAATNLGEGYTDPPGSLSPHYQNLSYVQVTGTATVTVYGDSAVNDAAYLAAAYAKWAPIVAGNAVGAAVDFENCVAG